MSDDRRIHICDMIKWNESDVADIAFETLETKTVQLCNQISNFDEVYIKITIFEVMRKWRKKLGIVI